MRSQSETGHNNLGRTVARTGTVLLTVASLAAAVGEAASVTPDQANRNILSSADSSAHTINSAVTDQLLGKALHGTEITPDMFNDIKNQYNANFDKFREVGRLLDSMNQFPSTYNINGFTDYISVLFQIQTNLNANTRDFAGTLTSSKGYLDQVENTLAVSLDNLNQQAESDDAAQRAKTLAAACIGVLSALILAIDRMLNQAKRS